MGYYGYFRNQRGDQRSGLRGQQNVFEDVINKINGMKSLSELDPKEFADRDGYAAKVAQELHKMDMKTHQLRKFFDPLVKIRDDLKKNKASWKDKSGQVYLTLPMLAFSVGRGLAPEAFFKLVRTCINKVEKDTNEEKQKESFLRFMDFMEAVIAYEKYFEEIQG